MDHFKRFIVILAIVAFSSCRLFTGRGSSRTLDAQETLPVEIVEDMADDLPLEVVAICEAYPDHVIGFEDGKLLFANGESIVFDEGGKGEEDAYLLRLDSTTVKDMFHDVYPLGALTEPPYMSDPGRYRNEAFFKAMYGHTEKEVSSRLETVDVFGTKIRFSSVNGAADSLRSAVRDVADNHPELVKFFNGPSSFYWRQVRGANRMSAHSYGIAVDIGVKYANYWLWANKNASETDPIAYQNHFPAELIYLFEKHGFISGARWYHYDTMHFEFRPELIGYSRMVSVE